MSYRVEPITREPPRRIRAPRRTNDAHLSYIRQLPCAVCGDRPVDPAHLRTGNLLLGKRAVGAAEKPSDLWCAPLCRHHHDEQHSMSEVGFWLRYGVHNPWQLCLALWAASGEVEAGEAICNAHRSRY